MSGMNPGKIMMERVAPNSDWLESVDVAPGVKAFVTTRGEASLSPYSSFNICHYTGDSPDAVKCCRKALVERLGLEDGALVVPRQTHSARCRVIGLLPAGEDELYGVDALVTSLPGVAIGVSTADCVPVLLADVNARVVGVAHAGWRGALDGVLEAAVGSMVGQGAMTGDIRVAFGPCICAACFEVGEDVACRFPGKYVLRSPGARPHVDLPGYVASRLVDCGIAASAIAPPLGCTRCAHDRYFSARALGVDSGRNFTFIYLD